MNFGASDPLHDYQIAAFGGVDFTTLENKVNPGRSPDAVNMVMNHNGYLEKRTGYRRLYEGTHRINGLFEYSPAAASETFYLMHEGTELYQIRFTENGSIEEKTLLLEGLGDTKTRHFVYNDRLYILGAGYIQVRYRDGALSCGFVKNIGTSDMVVDYMTGRTPGSETDGTIVAPHQSTDTCIKAVYYKLESAVSTRSAGTGERMRGVGALHIPSDDESVKIESVYVLRAGAWTEWHKKFVEINDSGKSLRLLGNPVYGSGAGSGTTFAESFTFDEIKVVYSEEPCATAPLMFINRSAVPYKHWTDGTGSVDNSERIWSYEDYKNTLYVEDSFLGKLPLDGDSVDSANFANGRRKIQFRIPDTEKATCAYILYLTDAGGHTKINRITVDGVLVHDYTDIHTDTYLISSSNAACYADVSPSYEIDDAGRFVKINRIVWHEDYKTKLDSYTVNDNVQPGSVVEVDFTVLREEDSDDEQIDACSIYGIYGGNNDTRVFLSGNPKHKNRDYASGLYDATYFPNDMYTDIGSESSAIVGYHKLYSNQIIVKDEAAEDASQYLRSLSMDADGNVVYTLLQGNSTYGASCKSSFKQIGGIPFYVGPGGVYSIAGTTVQNQNNTTLRSLQINRRFLEENLTEAVCCTHNDAYIVAAGGHIWVCDIQAGMEWFYLDSLPEITCMWPHGKLLYFGTADGRVCVFNRSNDVNAYYDNLNPDGSADGAAAVKCYWCTPISAFDNWNMFKTVVNVYLSCMPYNNSSVHVYYNSSDEMGEDITTEEICLFDFSDMNFEKFSFDTIRQPKPFATGVKAKNVYVFGVKLENAEAQPFGIVSIGYKYKYSKYVK